MIDLWKRMCLLTPYCFGLAAVLLTIAVFVGLFRALGVDRHTALSLGLIAFVTCASLALRHYFRPVTKDEDHHA